MIYAATAIFFAFRTRSTDLQPLDLAAGDRAAPAGDVGLSR
jgi:hypothetical protein